MKKNRPFKTGVIMVLGLLTAFSVTAYTGQGDVKKGKRVYEQFCVPCHGLEGKGDGTRGKSERFDPMPRNHTNGEYMNKRPQEELTGVIKNGGFSKNFSHIMPPWKTVLTDDEIWDVLAYVRSLAVPPYQPAQ